MTCDRAEEPITTERLVLRAPQVADAEAIAAYVGDLEVARMLSPVPHPYTREDAEAFVARCADLPPDQRVFAVADRDGFAGLLGFQRENGERLCEVGYWFGRPHWGRGYATEALRAALARAAQGWGVRALLSGHFVDNPASGRVLEKAGFLYTGDRRPRISLARGEEVETRMMVWMA